MLFNELSEGAIVKCSASVVLLDISIPTSTALSTDIGFSGAGGCKVTCLSLSSKTSTIDVASFGSFASTTNLPFPSVTPADIFSLDVSTLEICLGIDPL